MLNSRSVSEPFKNIPFCIYRVSSSTQSKVALYYLLQDGQPVFQKLISSVSTADNKGRVGVFLLWVGVAMQ